MVDELTQHYIIQMSREAFLILIFRGQDLSKRKSGLPKWRAASIFSYNLLKRIVNTLWIIVVLASCCTWPVVSCSCQRIFLNEACLQIIVLFEFRRHFNWKVLAQRSVKEHIWTMKKHSSRIQPVNILAILVLQKNSSTTLVILLQNRRTES